MEHEAASLEIERVPDLCVNSIKKSGVWVVTRIPGMRVTLIAQDGTRHYTDMTMDDFHVCFGLAAKCVAVDA